MSDEQYSYVEKLEIIAALSDTLRDKRCNEDYFRYRVGLLGFNATDIEQYLTEALKQT